MGSVGRTTTFKGRDIDIQRLVSFASFSLLFQLQPPPCFHSSGLPKTSLLSFRPMYIPAAHYSSLHPPSLPLYPHSPFTVCLSCLSTKNPHCEEAKEGKTGHVWAVQGSEQVLWRSDQEIMGMCSGTEVDNMKQECAVVWGGKRAVFGIGGCVRESDGLRSPFELLHQLAWWCCPYCWLGQCQGESFKHW